MIAASCKQPETAKQDSTHEMKNTKDRSKNTDEIKSPTTIESIKLAYASTLNKLREKRLDSINITYNCQNERSGRITYFRDGGKIVLINHQSQENDHFESFSQYFVANDSVYFQFERELLWSFFAVNGDNAITKDDIAEKRTYLASGKALLCLQKKFSVYSDGSQAKDKSKIPNIKVNCLNEGEIKDKFSKLLKFQTQQSGTCFE